MAQLTDAYFDDRQDAYSEARRRRATVSADGFVTRVEPSPYGGWRVRTIPVEMLFEPMAPGGRIFSAYGGSFERRRRA